VQPWIVGAAVALVASAGVLSPTAAADDKVPLGGGAGVVVDGSHCTLNSIGHDNTGELVGSPPRTAADPVPRSLPRAPKTTAHWAPWPQSATVWTIR
jgi:hypothetical protein